MKKLSVLTLLSACCCFVQADITAKNLDDANHLSGPKVALKDIQGKVVLVEYFGFGCGPCVAAMPHTVKLAESFKENPNFVVLLSHAWSKETGLIMNFLERTGAKHLPTYQGLLLANDALPGGVPNARVYNHEGKRVWSGHPANATAMKQAIEEALAAAPTTSATRTPAVLDFGPVKYNQDMAKRFVPGKKVDAALKTLKMRAEKENEKGTEAAHMIAAFRNWAGAQKSQARALKAERPSKALMLLKQLKTMSSAETADCAADFAELTANQQTVELARLREKIEKLERLSPERRLAEVKKLTKALDKYDASSPDVKDIADLLDFYARAR